MDFKLKCLGALYGSGPVPTEAEAAAYQAEQAAAHALEESERSHQRRLHFWLKEKYIPHFAPFNEGYRNEQEARGAKIVGMSPGIPDLVITVARRPFHGLYMELKARPHGRVSGAQEHWIRELNLQGYAAGVSWSFDESLDIVEAYLALPRWEKFS